MLSRCLPSGTPVVASDQFFERSAGKVNSGNLKVTPSSGNVFRDLGFSVEEAERLLFRADLLIGIRKRIAGRRLTQAQAAKLMRVSQSCARRMVQGRGDRLSTDTLIDILTRLGVRVRLSLESIRRPKSPLISTGRPLAGMKRFSGGFRVSAPIEIQRRHA